MTTKLVSVQTDDKFPTETSVVVIGGGIVGVSAALTLAERGIPVVLLEKGRIGGEQSSRNLGWIRKTNRHHNDVPLALAADKLWAEMPKRLGQDVGYQQAGILFLAGTDAEVAAQQSWLDSVADLSLDSKLISAEQIDQLIPGGRGQWKAGLYTPSDGRAEPALATSAMAQTAIKQGAVLVQNCAVRCLTTSAGKVSGVVTERGEIRCDQVLLAGGAWSRRFLGNMGIALPTLPLICSVLRTRPMQGPTEIAVGASNFSFRKHQDGGYIITQRGKLDAPLTWDHLKIGLKYLDQLRASGGALKVSFGKEFFSDLALSRRWSAQQETPFEQVRIRNPKVNHQLNQDAINNLAKAWPDFAHLEIEEAWAGSIDVTPDSTPVIDKVSALPGLSVATGFSGHGFGTGPAAGQLAADILSNQTTIIDPSPYKFDRF